MPRRKQRGIKNLFVNQSGNAEVLTCVNEQGETVISYAIILKVLDDLDAESILVS